MQHNSSGNHSTFRKHCYINYIGFCDTGICWILVRHIFLDSLSSTNSLRRFCLLLVPQAIPPIGKTRAISMVVETAPHSPFRVLCERYPLIQDSPNMALCDTYELDFRLGHIFGTSTSGRIGTISLQPLESRNAQQLPVG